MAIISIDYDEGDQKSYRAVEVCIGNDVKRFDGGLVEHDFANAHKYAYDNDGIVMLSSSCDHFVSDGWDHGWKMTDQGEVIYKLSHDEKDRYMKPRY